MENNRGNKPLDGPGAPNGNTWLKAEVLSAANTVTFLFDNLACHKIRIANTF